MTVSMDGDGPLLRGTQEQLRTVFGAAIQQLKPANRHHEFERLCVGHARRRFDPTLVVSGGPVSAGGDAGMDGFSSWVALDDDTSSTVTFFYPPGRVTAAVACTTTVSEKLSEKLRLDVAKIVAGDFPCGRIYFYSAESLSEAQWKKASDSIEISGVEIYYRRPENFAETVRHQSNPSLRAVELVIVDGLKLADDLSRADFSALAVDCLRLPPALLPMRRSLQQIHAIVHGRASAAMGRFGGSDVKESVPLTFNSELDRVLAQSLSREGVIEQIDELRILLEDVDAEWSKPFPVDDPDSNCGAAQRRSDAAIHAGWCLAAAQFDHYFRDLSMIRSAVPETVRQVAWARESVTVLDTLLGACIMAEGALEDAAKVTACPGPRRRSLRCVLRRLYAVDDAVRAIRRRLHAEASGVLLIEGGWGTGKTYHAARLAVGQIDRGAPTVFVDGSDWRLSEGPWIADFAKSFDSGINGDEFLGALRLHAEVTGQRAIIILDAVNEASVADWKSRLTALAAEVSQHPEIMLIATRRNDTALASKTTTIVTEPSNWAVYHHDGVDPTHAWDVLRRYFALPPVTAPWTIPDYRKPLVLRMFARVCSSSDRSARPLPFGELFDAWIRVLSVDFAQRRDRSAPGAYDHGELNAVLRHLDDDLGQGVSREAIRRAAGGLSSADVDKAIDFMCYEGVIAEFDGLLRYGLQRIAELRQAQRLLVAGHRCAPKAPRHDHIRKKWISPDPITQAMAELAPTYLGRDTLTRNRREWRAGMPEAFILSLSNRSISAVTETTIELTRTLLRRRGWTIIIWMSALQNAVIPGHPLGAGFIDREVSQMTPARRAQRWIEPLHAIMQLETDEDDSTTAEILLWIDREASRDALTPEHLDELARMLMWCLVLPPGSASASIARTLATILRTSPPLAVGLLHHAHSQHDLDVYCGVWNAMYGAIVRAGSTPAATALAEAAREHFHAHHNRPKGLTAHLRLHTAVYRALRAADKKLGHPGPDLALYEFLSRHGEQYDVGRVHRVRARTRDIPTRARDQLVGNYLRFSDEQGFRPDQELHRAAQLLGEVAARNGVRSYGRRRLQHESGAVGVKILDQMNQIWLAQLSLTNRYPGDVHWRRGDYVPHAPGTGRWILPRDGLDELCDTTVAVQTPLCVESIDPTDSAAIPFRLKVRNRYQHVPPIESGDFVYTEPDGSRWWVLAGEFHIEPQRRPHVSLGGLFGEPRRDTSSSPAHARRTFLVRIRTWLVQNGAHVPDAAPLDREGSTSAEWDSLAEELTCTARSAAPAVVPTSYLYQNIPQHGDYLSCMAPTAYLRTTLGLEWTGEGVTCVDQHGNTLKAAAKDGSYQMPYLIVNDGLLKRIDTLGYRLMLELTIVDHRDFAPDADRTRRCWLARDGS